MAVDLEGATGQPARPDVFVEDEVGSVQAAQRNVPLVDRCSEQVVIAAPDGRQALDRVVGRANDVVDDGVGHRREDCLDVTVVLGAELGIEEVIEAGALGGRDRFGLHTKHDRPER